MLISEVLSENFHFSVVKFSVYLNTLVLVMRQPQPGNATLTKQSFSMATKEGEMRNK